MGAVGRRFTFLWLAALTVAVVGAGSAGGAATPLQQRLAKALHVPHVSPARSGAVVLDLTTGGIVYTQNASRPLAPASNEKLPLTYAALSVLGPTYRFDTSVLGIGGQDGTIWGGPLVLQGNGDPTLSTAGLNSLALQVRAGGIRRVTGGIIADESWFDARRTVAGWKPSFYLDESPPLSALVVNRDRVGGYLSTNPALATATAFKTALRGAGITVTGPLRVGTSPDDFATPLGSVSSPTLASIIRFMDRESDNFTAEMLLKQLGAEELGKGTSAAGASVVTHALAAAGVPMTGVRIVDGSGLSTLDRLTTDALSSLLHSAWNDPAIGPLLRSSLPIAGINGTLQDRMRRGPARGHVVAKTGTTSDASALSGFVRNRYAFAILQNGHPLSYWWARVAQDRFAQVLAAQ